MNQNQHSNPQPDNNKEKNGPKRQFDKYIKYSNIAIQMGVIIGLGVWGGVKLDERYQTKKPYFTIALSLFAVIAAIYLVIRSVLQD